jgi:hypothetical protein
MVLASHNKRFLKLLFESLESVGHNVPMENPLLQASQELLLQVQPANQKAVCANGVTTLSMHRTAVARSFALAASSRDYRDTASAFRTEE